MDNLFAKYLEPHKESIDEGLKDAVIAAGQGIKAAAIKTKKAFKNVIDIKNKESFIDKVISTPEGGSFSSDTEKESDKIIFEKTGRRMFVVTDSEGKKIGEMYLTLDYVKTPVKAKSKEEMNKNLKNDSAIKSAVSSFNSN